MHLLVKIGNEVCLHYDVDYPFRRNNWVKDDRQVEEGWDKELSEGRRMEARSQMKLKIKK